MGNHQIELPVPIEIDPCRTYAPGVLIAPNIRCEGYILKRAIAAVVKKMIPSDTRNKQVQVSIVVVIAGRRTHSLQFHVQSRFVRHVGKMSMPIVAEKGTTPAPAAARPGR
jgi:hypothetical protein